MGPKRVLKRGQKRAVLAILGQNLEDFGLKWREIALKNGQNWQSCHNSTAADWLRKRVKMTLLYGQSAAIELRIYDEIRTFVSDFEVEKSRFRPFWPKSDSNLW